MQYHTSIYAIQERFCLNNGVFYIIAFLHMFNRERHAKEKPPKAEILCIELVREEEGTFLAGYTLHQHVIQIPSARTAKSERHCF